MTTDDSSELLAELVSPTSDDRLKEVIMEMQDIGDPIFLKPLRASYLLNLRKTFSHYYPIAIGACKDPENTKILEELLLMPGIDPIDARFFLNELTSLGYKSQPVNTYVINKFHILSETKPNNTRVLTDDDLDSLLGYMKSAGLLQESLNFLQGVIEQQLYEYDFQTSTLYHFMRIDPVVERLTLLLNLLPKLKGSHLERALAEEITHWKGTIIDQIKEKLLTEGGSGARRIISSAKTNAERQEEKNEETQALRYSGLTLYEEIIVLRNNINLHSLAMWGFKLLPDYESLLTQAKTCTSKSDLVASCINFRSLIQNIDNKTREHGLSDEAVLSLIPNVRIEDTKLSLNSLFLFLHSKGISVGLDLFGLRPVNIFANLLAHPEGEKELVLFLAEFKLKEVYETGDWDKLHKYILTKYKEFLAELNKLIINLDKQP